jgi:hypothetical protein
MTMVISKSVLDEVIASIANGQANYQKFVIIITTDFKCKFKCDHMIGTTDAAAIDIISDTIIQYCSQHYILGYTAQYIDKTAKCIELHIRRDIDPDSFVKHGYWSQVNTGDRIGDYYFVCSHCHKNTPDKAFIIAPDYCPWCGAKMRSEV